MSRVVVVGGGPAGLTVASLIRDRDVLVYEEHPRFGEPRHCTSIVGLYTASFFAKLLTPRVVKRGYKRFLFHTRLGSYLVEFSREVAFYLERPLLEEKLADKASRLGHSLQTGVRAKPLDTYSVRAGDGIVRFDRLVVADGSTSEFFRFFNGRRREYLYGLQALVEHEGGEDAIHVEYGVGGALFSWFVPIGDGLGLAGYLTEKHVGDPRSAVKKVLGVAGVKYRRLLGFFGGVVVKPGQLSRPHIRGRVFFIGDALGLVKPFTYGGLYYVARLARVLVESLENPATYEREVKRLARLNSLERGFSGIGVPEIAPPILKVVSSSGLFNPIDYDEHFRLILKTAASPLLVYLTLFKSVA